MGASVITMIHVRRFARDAERALLVNTENFRVRARLAHWELQWYMSRTTMRVKANTVAFMILAEKFECNLKKFRELEEINLYGSTFGFISSVAVDEWDFGGQSRRSSVLCSFWFLVAMYLIDSFHTKFGNDFNLVKQFEQRHNVLRVFLIWFDVVIVSSIVLCLLLKPNIYSAILKVFSTITMTVLLVGAEVKVADNERATAVARQQEYRRRVQQLQRVDITPEHYMELLGLDEFVERGDATPLDVVKRLPTHVCDNSKVDEMCPICLSEIEKGDRVKVLPCYHNGHESCIDTWLKRDNRCPVCQRQVDIEE